MYICVHTVKNCKDIANVIRRYFTAVDLAEIAQQLDEQERSHMAEFGVNTREYLEYISQESGNYDDSGFFSSQVVVTLCTVLNFQLFHAVIDFKLELWVLCPCELHQCTG